MKKPLIIVVTVVAVTVGIVIVRQANRGPGGNGSNQSLGRVPDLTLKDFSGREVRFADFQGQPLVINSWAAWCPFCRGELPDFAAVQKELGDNVVIIAIDRAESVETQKQYTDELGVTSDLVFLSDPGDSFYQSIGGFSMPETIFVDKDGNIVDHKRGPMDRKEIGERINNILN